MLESVWAMNIRGQKFLHEMLDQPTVISGPPGSGEDRAADGAAHGAQADHRHRGRRAAGSGRSPEPGNHERTARHQAKGPDGLIVITGCSR